MYTFVSVDPSAAILPSFGDTVSHGTLGLAVKVVSIGPPELTSTQ